MKRILTVACTLCFLTPAVRAQGGPGGPGGVLFCLARIDDRGNVHVRHISGMEQPEREITVKKTNDKGQVFEVKVKVKSHTVEESTATIHSSAVELFDMAGKPLDAKNLATLLKQERPVLVFQGKPDAKYLTGFKKDIPVLGVPVLHNDPLVAPGTTAPVPAPIPPPRG